MTRQRINAGFTLLEILISIVIVAFGLLGIAGLQAYALKHNHSAGLRLTATALASDMIDRMKANHAAVSSLQYHQTSLANYTTFVAGCSTGGVCTSTDLANNDLAEWQAKVAELLPGGQGIVCRDSTPDDGTPADPRCDNLGDVAWAVKIWWNDNRTDPNAVPQRFWTNFNP